MLSKLGLAAFAIGCATVTALMFLVTQCQKNQDIQYVKIKQMEYHSPAPSPEPTKK